MKVKQLCIIIMHVSVDLMNCCTCRKLKPLHVTKPLSYIRVVNILHSPIAIVHWPVMCPPTGTPVYIYTEDGDIYQNCYTYPYEYNY